MCYSLLTHFLHMNVCFINYSLLITHYSHTLNDKLYAAGSLAIVDLPSTAPIWGPI